MWVADDEVGGTGAGDGDEGPRELAELGMCRVGVEGELMSYCAYDIAHIVV